MTRYTPKAVVAAVIAVIGLSLYPAQGNQLSLWYGSRHSGNGGEFNVQSGDFNPAGMGYKPKTIYNGGFETFCVETNEFFSPGSTYNYGISQAAIHGGVGGGDPDPLSRGSAWLYLKFATDSLSGYNYHVNSLGNASAGALQNTIWYLEGEGVSPDAYFLSLVQGHVSNYTADNNGFYGVGVLNLWNADGSPAQDQLVLIPSVNQHGLPDGGTTVMLMGGALTALGLLRRFVC